MERTEGAEARRVVEIGGDGRAGLIQRIGFHLRHETRRRRRDVGDDDRVVAKRQRIAVARADRIIAQRDVARAEREPATARGIGRVAGLESDLRTEGIGIGRGLRIRADIQPVDRCQEDLLGRSRLARG